MDERWLARGLGWFSIGLGLAEVTVTRGLAGFFGMEGSTGLVRLFGLREIATGVGILAAGDPTPLVGGGLAGTRWISRRWTPSARSGSAKRTNCSPQCGG